MKENKGIYLISETIVSPSLLQGVDFNRNVRDNDQELFLQKNSNFEKNKKYILKVKAPVTHGQKISLKDAVYLPRGLKRSARSFYEPNYKPIIKEHQLGLDSSGKVVDAIGRVRYAQYQSYLSREEEEFSLADSIAKIQKMMRDGTIYNPEWRGHGAIFAEMRIADQEAIEQFLDERIMNFSVGGYSNQVYSPFNGKHVLELEDGDLGPYDELDGMPGFKVVDTIEFDELSTTLAPADILAKVSSMELEEFRISDSTKTESHNKIKTKSIFFSEGLFNLELKGENKMENQFSFSIQDYCGPNNSFPVTNKDEAIKALAELKDSDLDGALKQKIERAIKAKLSNYEEKNKNVFTNKEILKDSVSKLSTFELIDFVENLRDNLKEVLEDRIVAELFGVKDSTQESKRILEADLKNTKLELEAAKNELKDLRDSSNKAKKSFVFLAKSIRDNQKFESFDQVSEETKSEEFEELLKDSALFQKLERIFAGLDPQKPESQDKLNNEINRPTDVNDSLELSDITKTYKKLYIEKKTQDGLAKATKWLQNLKDNKYISDQEFDQITKEN